MQFTDEIDTRYLELDGCFRPRMDKDKFVGDKVFRLKGYKTEK